MNRFLLVPALGVAAVFIAASAGAQTVILSAPARPAYIDEARQPYFESRRIAYDNGFREGVRKGEEDARRNRAFYYQNERTWQRGDKGYHRSYGDRERYRQSFRSGYAAGYTDGFRRFAPFDGRYNDGRVARPGPPPSSAPRTSGRYQYPGRPGYGYGYNPAYANGARDGYEKGREDARDRDRYDPLRHKRYRSGDHDYEREYGPKDRYRTLYREGFKDGYDRGYREWIYRR